jgi:phage repressor protein C with HTH and peptisase S24 domain
MHNYLRYADLDVNPQKSDLQIASMQIAVMERHERLKLARARKFKTAKAAAQRLGVPYGTYSGHEANTRGFDEEIERYARAFQVRAAWLAFEEGPMEPNGKPTTEQVAASVQVPVVGRIGAGGTIDTSSEQISEAEPLYEITIPPPPDDDPIAFEVTGGSMWPRYDDGDVIVCSRRGRPIETIIGQEAAVAASDGSRYLKRVIEGSQRGLYNLESHNADVIRDVDLVWASDVITVIRAHRARGQAPRRHSPQPASGTRQPTSEPSTALDPTGSFVGDRLRRLRLAIGENAIADFLRRAGLQRLDWERFESTGSIDGRVAILLCQTVPGLSMGWIYYEETAALPGDLRERLAGPEPRRIRASGGD